jgi:putative ABC transport system permease protein
MARAKAEAILNRPIKKKHKRSTHMLASIFSLNVLQTALELGCIYALVALALFLNIADLSTDGCFTLGCAVACQVALTGHPILALVAAMAAGVCSGFVTAFLQTRLGVESIMAGIIVNTGLYTINLAVMGFSSTMSLVKTDTVFSLAKGSLSFLGGWYKLAIALAMILLAGAAMLGFLGTRLGLSIRATGDNAAMVRASSINPAFTITVGLCISGALCALSGGLLAQYQKSCDINVGTGMVTIALASLIIGETLLGKRTMLRRIIGVVFGSCLYRFIVAVALRFNVPAAAMKLVSAIIVAIAISMPAIKEKIAFEQRKHGACRRRVTTGKEGK